MSNYDDPDRRYSCFSVFANPSLPLTIVNVVGQLFAVIQIAKWFFARWVGGVSKFPASSPHIH